MRFVIVLLMLATSASAQDPNTTLPAFATGPQIEQAAFRSFAELEAKVARLEEENAKLVNELSTLKAQQQPTPAAKIVMESIEGCQACEQWWTKEAPRYSAAGWHIDRVKVSPQNGVLYPRWRLCIGDECQVISWCPFNQLDAKVQSILDRRKQ